MLCAETPDEILVGAVSYCARCRRLSRGGFQQIIEPPAATRLLHAIR